MNRSVAVVGATGVVGAELLQVFQERNFPVGQLGLFASAASAGRQLEFAGNPYTVQATDAAKVSEHQLVFLSAGATVTRQLAPTLRAAGCRIYDNTSAFRLADDVPLVVPEVNLHAMTADDPHVAVPNCTAILLVLSLGPLQRAFGLRRVIVSSYQAVSGAGRAALDRLLQEAGDPPTACETADPGVDPFAFNVIPAIGEEAPGLAGSTGEEAKVVAETRRILDRPDLAMVATCVRVPVIRAHSESVVVELCGDPSLDEVRQVFAESPWIDLRDDLARGLFPTPRKATGIDGIQLGRLRKADGPGHFAYFLAGDQLRKGAALNAVQIAEQHTNLPASE